MIFRPQDAQDLRKKILEYFDEDLQKKLSRNLEPLKKDLSWEKFSSKLLQTIKSL
jgi:glycosyltransferase involved in cell wall biosynthesis